MVTAEQGQHQGWAGTGSELLGARGGTSLPHTPVPTQEPVLTPGFGAGSGRAGGQGRAAQVSAGFR